MLKWSSLVVVFLGIIIMMMPGTVASLDVTSWFTILCWSVGTAGTLSFIADIFKSILKV